MFVGVGVCVGVALGAKVQVGRGVRVGVDVLLGVSVRVGVGVAVAVGVGLERAILPMPNAKNNRTNMMPNKRAVGRSGLRLVRFFITSFLCLVAEEIISHRVIIMDVIHKNIGTSGFPARVLLC